MTSKHYKYFQPNDKDKKDDQSDCVIRALCKVMNKTGWKSLTNCFLLLESYNVCRIVNHVMKHSY